ncbi:unnamed protein product [Dicrocoelium dendriticum]|nr:unnamed protein product [Dicrocoelium dendriticum]
MLLGTKYAMFTGSVCYVAFIATFIEPRAWSIYLGSIVSGCGAAGLLSSLDSSGCIAHGMFRRNKREPVLQHILGSFPELFIPTSVSWISQSSVRRHFSRYHL